MRLDWILVVIGTSVGAALSGLLANEFKAWIAYFPKWLVRRATSWLPEDQRERYAEEWLSHINEMPGDICKIATAIGFVLAAKRMPAKMAKKRPIIVPGVPQGVRTTFVNATCRIEIRGESRSTAVISARLDRES